jgi:choice-of-anchor B domain-containing protein
MPIQKRSASSSRRLRFGSAALVAAAAASAVFAHEDDPKALEKYRYLPGPIWRAADGGVAGETFTADGIALKAWFPVNAFDQQGVVNTSGNDCWGYVSPSGREYALVGLSGGTGFVEVTNPAASTIVAFFPGPTSLWRNVKTYKQYAYSVSEGGGGIQVFDLSGIDQGTIVQLPSVLTGGDSRTHTMIINETTGYLYRMGGGSNGVRIYNLEPNPASPVFVTQWSDKYTHDGFVHNYTSGPYAGKEIFFACGGLNGGFAGTGVDIIDVTNKANLVVLSNFQYPQAAFCHQAWISKDERHIYINDEIDENNFGLLNVGRIVNVENLSAPFLAGTYTTGLTSVDHNLYVKGDTLFCSNYKTGLQVFDITNQTQPVRKAFFDTYPEGDATGYAGLWSNYPYFPSGTILGSDIERGLFVWRLQPPVATFGYPNGTPGFIDPRGGQTLDVSIAPASGAEIVAGSETMLLSVDGAPPVAVPLASLGGSLYRATFPAFTCGDAINYSFQATAADGTVAIDPPGGFSAIAALGEPQLLFDPVENPQGPPNGWIAGVPGDTATSGQWVNVDPNGTSAQPENDNTPNGVKAWVTGNAAVGSGAGAADVDGGKTTLVSPVLALADLPEARISYFRWYSNNQGSNPGTDSMPVEITNDGGTTWVQLELVTENAGAWVKKSFRVADFVAPTNNVRVRWVARDDAAGSLVEAGVDDFAVSTYDCPTAILGDLDGNGTVDAADLAVLLGQWGQKGSADLDGDGTVNAADLAVLLGAWS